LKIDALDLAIVKALRADARRTFESIAEELGMSPSAVKSRFNKMKRSGLIRGSTVIVDWFKLGAHITQLCVRTIESETENVVEYINGLEVENGLVSCWEVFGHYNILAWIWLMDPLKLHLLKQMVQRHPGVIEVNISIFSNLTHLYESNVELKLPGMVRS
jgi:DNA-binding Lrp family transcriptional regulator